MPEPRTDGNASGSWQKDGTTFDQWRTPTASTTGGIKDEYIEEIAKNGTAYRPSGHKVQMDLMDQVKDKRLHPKRMIPTPTCSDAYTSRMESSQTKDTTMHSVTLARLVEREPWKMWPTPCAVDYKGSRTPWSLVSKSGINRLGQLPNAVAYHDIYATPTTMDSLPPKSEEALKHEKETRPGRTKPANLRDQVANAVNWIQENNYQRPKGQLNPDWTEWLMGWPIGWTSTEPMEHDTFFGWEELQGSWWDTDPADLNLIPRMAEDIKDRVKRIKAIGNGQVPLTAVLAWNTLMGEGDDRFE